MDILGLDKLEPQLAAAVQSVASELENKVSTMLAAAAANLETNVTQVIQNTAFKGTVTIGPFTIGPIPIDVDLALAPSAGQKAA
jgi:hypothetical protein